MALTRMLKFTESRPVPEWTFKNIEEAVHLSFAAATRAGAPTDAKDVYIGFTAPTDRVVGFTYMQISWDEPVDDAGAGG